MPSPTTTERVRATRCSPGGWTKEREREQRRKRFALALLPLLTELRDAGAVTNPQLAEELNRRGVASETGRPWTAQGVAAIGRRLEQLMPVLPPRPRWRRRIPREA